MHGPWGILARCRFLLPAPAANDELAQAQLIEVAHGSVVTLRFALPATQAAALRVRLSESGRGQLVWLDGDTLE